MSKNTLLLPLKLLCAGAFFCLACNVPAADTNTEPKSVLKEQDLSQWKNMTPEERRARLEEMRKGKGNYKVAAHTNQFGDLNGLTPERRREKFLEYRRQQTLAANGGSTNKATLAQRSEKFDSTLEQLRRKKTDGSITPLEEKQLSRMEAVAAHAKTNAPTRSQSKLPEKTDLIPSPALPAKTPGSP